MTEQSLNDIMRGYNKCCSHCGRFSNPGKTGSVILDTCPKVELKYRFVYWSNRLFCTNAIVTPSAQLTVAEKSCDLNILGILFNNWVRSPWTGHWPPDQGYARNFVPARVKWLQLSQIRSHSQHQGHPKVLQYARERSHSCRYAIWASKKMQYARKSGESSYCSSSWSGSQ